MTDLSEDPEGDFIARWSARLGCLLPLVVLVLFIALAFYEKAHPTIRIGASKDTSP